jgi:hypothetical protein
MRFHLLAVLGLGLLSLTSFAQGADAPKAPDPAKVTEAKKTFAAGVNLLQDPDGARYEEALPLFRKVYELIGTWKVLGNVGLCSMKLERDGEAVEAYDRYLKDGGTNIEADERAQVERDLATLKASVVTVEVQFPSAAGTLFDERTNVRGNKILNQYPVVKTTATLGIHSGHHLLILRADGKEAQWETDLQAGGTVKHKFEFAASKIAAAPTTAPGQGAPGADADSRPVPTSVYIVGGTTIALTLGAVVTGAMALSKRSAFNDANGQPGRQADAQSLHDSAVTMGLVNTILTGGAIVGAGVTGYLYFARPKKAQAPTVGSLSPWISSDGAGLVLRGDL